MGDHTHERGEWTLSYRFMQTSMAGNRDGTGRLETADVLREFMVAPRGLNLYFPSGALKGHRLAAEWHIPVYQSLNGPQLETDRVLTVGWQKSFDPIGHH